MAHFQSIFKDWLRKHWLTCLQVALSVVLLAQFFGNAEFREEMARLFLSADGRWLAAGVLSALATELLCTVRWWLMLKIFGVPVGLARTCAFSLAGLFYSFFLPGAGGGDAFRILYVMRVHPRQKLRAAMSVIADRLCGMVALVLALGLTLAKSNDLPLDARARDIINLSAIVLAGPVVMVFLWWLTTFPAIHRHGVRLLPAKLRKPLTTLGEKFWQTVRHPREVSIAIAVSCVALTAHFTTYFFSARAFALPVTLGGIFTVMPVVDALIMLPVTFYGVGLRETVLQSLMGSMFGIPGAAATMTSLAGFGLQAMVGLLGGLLIPFTLPRLAKPPNTHPHREDPPADGTA
ncbi:MAG: flippase-like domain-containing protein [Chthoniobacterales bacterium]|nr:flippase-like domain-containing protein [Chthoniobacterales bacterium]